MKQTVLKHLPTEYIIVNSRKLGSEENEYNSVLPVCFNIKILSVD